MTRLSASAAPFSGYSGSLSPRSSGAHSAFGMMSSGYSQYTHAASSRYPSHFPSDYRNDWNHAMSSEWIDDGASYGYAAPMSSSPTSSLPFYPSHTIAPPREPSPPLYKPPKLSSSPVFITRSGQEIEFLETAMNVPWRR